MSEHRLVLSPAQKRALLRAITHPRQMVDLHRTPEHIRDRLVEHGYIRAGWAGTVEERTLLEDGRLKAILEARDLLNDSTEHWALALNKLQWAGELLVKLKARAYFLTEDGRQILEGDTP
jgi:hypothetical protein